LVTLSFHQVEGIIGNSLPLTAFQSAEWWKNSRTAAQQAWLDVGWHVENVDMAKRTVSLRREKGILRVEKEQTGKKRRQKTAPRLLPKAEPRKRRAPSKTRMAKMVARLKNVERQRLAARTYPGQPKSRPSHEKRLFKTKQT
jgi:hypothetical protein